MDVVVASVVARYDIGVEVMARRERAEWRGVARYQGHKLLTATP